MSANHCRPTGNPWTGGFTWLKWWEITWAYSILIVATRAWLIRPRWASDTAACIRHHKNKAQSM